MNTIKRSELYSKFTKWLDVHYRNGIPLKGSFYDFLDEGPKIVSDGFQFSDEALRKLRMLEGPHAATVIKAWHALKLG